MTRLVPWFTASDKEYVATLSLGAETDTLDPEGVVIASAPPPDEASFRRALESFRGEIMQVPPLYSSVHVNGKRAHELARAGIEKQLDPRPVTIHEIEVLDFSGATARLRVSCSKGTYIRSLARDIAIACGSRAHLSALHRTRVGAFYDVDAIDPAPYSRDDESARNKALGLIRGGFTPIDGRALEKVGVPCATVSASWAARIANGSPVDPSTLGNLAGAPVVGLVDDGGALLALSVLENGARRYGFVLAAPQTKRVDP